MSVCVVITLLLLLDIVWVHGLDVVQNLRESGVACRRVKLSFCKDVCIVFCSYPNDYNTFFVAHKACWFFQVLLNYFDTLNISFLFVFFSVVYFIMFQLTITWFCLRYDFMFTKMFLFCQRLLRNSSYVSPLSLQPTLPTEYLMCVLVLPRFQHTGGGFYSSNECVTLFTMLALI